MFELSDDDLNKKILGCGDGPASFNVEATERGCEVVSCDPVYQFQVGEIRRRIDEVYPEIMTKVRQDADKYIWESLSSVEHLGEVRINAGAMQSGDRSPCLSCCILRRRGLEAFGSGKDRFICRWDGCLIAACQLPVSKRCY